jgi:hypothetical protein
MNETQAAITPSTLAHIHFAAQGEGGTKLSESIDPNMK